MDNRVRRLTRAPDWVRTENSDETAVCRSRERSLERRELGSSECEGVERVAPFVLFGRPMVGCIIVFVLGLSTWNERLLCSRKMPNAPLKYVTVGMFPT